MPVSVALLIVTALSVWIPPVTVSGTRRIPIWPMLLLCALSIAAYEGFVGALGLIAILVLWGSTLSLRRSIDVQLQALALNANLLFAQILCVALAAHKLPGFSNPVMIDGVRFTADAALFTQHANFDKGVVGVILLALVCNPAQSSGALFSSLKTALIATAVACAVIFPVAVTAQLTRLSVQIPSQTITFLFVNLALTCLAEECFFRGLLQTQLTQHLKQKSWGTYVAIAAPTILFGTVHLGGGFAYVVFATTLGLICATTYHVTKRIETAILTHFFFNATHFLAFVYPFAIK